MGCLNYRCLRNMFSSALWAGSTVPTPLDWRCIGWSLNTFAMLAATTVISTYVLDCFPQHAALASSWLNFWRVTGKALTRHH